MSCFDCKYFTGEDYLACGVDPITAANSPELGCRDWEQNPNPWGFWEVLLNPPHVDDIQIGWVPINGWRKINLSSRIKHYGLCGCPKHIHRKNIKVAFITTLIIIFSLGFVLDTNTERYEGPRPLTPHTERYENW